MSFLEKYVDSYTGLGIVMGVFGLPFALFSYYVLMDSTLTALGLACLVVGSVLVFTPSNPVPRQSVRAIMEASVVNVEALLEEYDASMNAVYLPPRDGRVFAFLPLNEYSDQAVTRLGNVPVRVIVESGAIRGLMVLPPGSEAVRLADLGEDSGVEDALNYVLVDFLESVESVQSVTTGSNVVVQFKKPVLTSEYSRFNMLLGSLPASIAGCVIAGVLDAPVSYLSEDISDDSYTVRFRVLDGQV
jgi:hypothetical protein